MPFLISCQFLVVWVGSLPCNQTFLDLTFFCPWHHIKGFLCGKSQQIYHRHFLISNVPLLKIPTFCGLANHTSLVNHWFLKIPYRLQLKTTKTLWWDLNFSRRHPFVLVELYHSHSHISTFKYTKSPNTSEMHKYPGQFLETCCICCLFIILISYKDVYIIRKFFKDVGKN